MSITKKTSFLTCNILILSLIGYAQESIDFNSGERISPLQKPEIPMMLRNGDISSEKVNPFQEKNFLVDTLALPFVDDFSANKQKNYFFYPTGSVIDSIRNHFSVNNLWPDTFIYHPDTTKYFIYNNITGQYDTLNQTPKQVVFYQNPSALTTPSDTQYLYSAFQFSINSAGDTIDSTLVFPYDTLINPKHWTFIKDDSYSLWEDSLPNVYINQTFAKDPMTIGMATFDGVDYLGSPYDLSFANTQGMADVLTSKPIDLEYLTSDSVYLSFYFQPTGLGDSPEKEDSLVLEFYSPSTKQWHWIWSSPGATVNTNFSQVKQAIQDALFLKKGFQFRFKNYATLSGSYDHWNIDYVWLDKNRSLHNEILTDVAFVNPISSILEDYTRVPWDHYKASSSGRIIQQTEAPLNNLGNSPRFVEKSEHIKDIDGSTLAFNQNLASPSLPIGITNIMLNIENAPLSFSSFPLHPQDRISFKFLDYLSVTPDANAENDTLAHTQVFDTYYAYDDASAEAAYILQGQGAKIAQKYSAYLADTLKGLLFMFPKNADNMAGNDIKVKVWSDIFSEDVLFEQVVTPSYGNELQGFVRISLEDSPVLVSGDFYVGWENLSSQDALIGFDRNTDNKDQLYIDFGGGWNTSLIEGTVMIRPDFGQANLAVSIPTQTIESRNLLIYPNPSSGLFYVAQAETFESIEVWNTYGQMIKKREDNLNDPIDLSAQGPGIYLIQARKEGRFYTQKLMVQP